MAASNVVAFKSNVASAGTPNTLDIAGAAGMNSLAATRLLITNTHATGTLEITVSSNGTDYTALEFDVNPNQSVTLDDVDVDSMKVDADTSGTTYTVLAWR